MSTTRKHTPIRRSKLSEQVLERLVEMIESGELGNGDRMPSERELMDMYDVGRPAVREALQSLASMGMIMIQHGERARVTPPTAQSMIGQIDRSARYLLSSSPSNIDHLKEARLLFEIGMTRIAATKATAVEIEHLRRLVGVMEDRAGTAEPFIQADMDFHRAIAAISGNPIYAAVAQAMLQWLAEYHVDIVSFPEGQDVTLSEHHKILARLAANDPEGAVQAMSDHLTRASSLYRARTKRSR